MIDGDVDIFGVVVDQFLRKMELFSLCSAAAKIFSTFGLFDKANRHDWLHGMAARLLILLAVTMSPLCAHAQKFGDPSSGIDAAKFDEVRALFARLDSPAEIRQVELALSWPHQLRFASLTEQTLLGQGCVYRTSDSGQISAIATLLKNAHPVPPVKSADRSLERMITFSFADGSTFRVDFSEVLSTDRNLPAASQNVPLVVDNVFGDQLLHWAATFHQENGCAGFVSQH